MTNEQTVVARVAGLSLIAMAVLAGFAYGYGFTTLQQAAQQVTIAAIEPIKELLRLVILSFTGILVLDVIVAWALFGYFKPVSENVARLMAWMRLVYVVFLAGALSTLLPVLQSLKAAPQNGQLLTSYLTAFQNVWSLGLIIFGLHLMLLAYLMLRSTAVPRVLGLLTSLAAACYFGTNTVTLLMPGYQAYKANVEAVLGLPMALGELGLAVWLVFKGSKQARLPRLHNTLSNAA